MRTETEELAQRLLIAMLASVSDLEPTRDPAALREGLIALAFDLAERFLKERDRRREH